MTIIDTTFDFQAEAGLNSKGEERDSDRYSPTLQEYHRLLWSKPLPTGERFGLLKIRNNQMSAKSYAQLQCNLIVKELQKWKII